MRWLVAVASVVLLAGCAASGPAYTPAPSPGTGDALVHIYRPDAYQFSAMDAYFYLDDVNIVDLTNKGYTWFHIPAGDYTLKQKWPAGVTYGAKPIGGLVRWQPGQTYFYRLRIEPGFGVIEWRLKQVSATEGTIQLRECRLQPAFGLEKLLQQRREKCPSCK